MKVRIWIEFPEKAAAEDWLTHAKALGLVPDDAKAFPVDGLDREGTRNLQEFILRRQKEIRIGKPLDA